MLSVPRKPMPRLWTRIVALQLAACLLADPLIGQASASISIRPAYSILVRAPTLQSRFSQEAVPAALAGFYRTFVEKVASRLDRWVLALRDREAPESIWYGQLFDWAMQHRIRWIRRVITYVVAVHIAPRLDP